MHIYVEHGSSCDDAYMVQSPAFPTRPWFSSYYRCRVLQEGPAPCHAGDDDEDEDEDEDQDDGYRMLPLSFLILSLYLLQRYSSGAIIVERLFFFPSSPSFGASCQEVLRLSHLRLTSRGASLLLQAVAELAPRLTSRSWKDPSLCFTEV